MNMSQNKINVSLLFGDAATAKTYFWNITFQNNDQSWCMASAILIMFLDCKFCTYEYYIQTTSVSKL